MNGAMFNSLARFIDRNYPRVSFSHLCRKTSLNTNVFAELTWYPDSHLPEMMQALSEQTETDLSTLWREFGRETFSYFADIFGAYLGGVHNFSDMITGINK
ncbi:MAG: heme NO-binding domain-containing protein, partial [Candidatus Zixiibacteriota bacterium]